jgi:hypothetical protein
MLGRMSTATASTPEAADETGDMVVVTIALPGGPVEVPAVWACEHAVTITGPGDYRHEVRLPLEADMTRLHVQLYGDVLELRAPRGPEPVQRRLAVRVLRR